ncbi:NIPSNAP family protein [Rhizobium alvei]|uniref:NIPSNAP family protein n=1 Tax=Rhizobium alvei TaxID=1132659 RepID=UPI003397025E
MSPVFEVVSGQIRLNRRREFFELHSSVLLPIMLSYDIRPKMLLFTELGRFSRFLDIYEYDSMADYESKTDQLVADERIGPYYEKVGECVEGGITVELMSNLPYSSSWVSHDSS